MKMNQQYSFAGRVIALPKTGGIGAGELTVRLRVSRQAIHQWRTRSKSPQSKRIGNVVTLDADAVAAWIAERGATVVRY